QRFAQLDPETELAAALLDQRVAAGVGHALKAEVCSGESGSAVTPVGALDAPTRLRLYATARHQLTSNLTTNRRTTYRNGLAVYRRARLPLPPCRATVKNPR